MLQIQPATFSWRPIHVHLSKSNKKLIPTLRRILPNPSSGLRHHPAISDRRHISAIHRAVHHHCNFAWCLAPRCQVHFANPTWEGHITTPLNSVKRSQNPVIFRCFQRLLELCFNSPEPALPLGNQPEPCIIDEDQFFVNCTLHQPCLEDDNHLAKSLQVTPIQHQCGNNFITSSTHSTLAYILANVLQKANRLAIAGLDNVAQYQRRHDTTIVAPDTNNIPQYKPVLYCFRRKRNNRLSAYAMVRHRQSKLFAPTFRGCQEIKCMNTAQEFWRMTRHERRAYPGHGSVRSDMQCPATKSPPDGTGYSLTAPLPVIPQHHSQQCRTDCLGKIATTRSSDACTGNPRIRCGGRPTIAGAAIPGNARDYHQTIKPPCKNKLLSPAPYLRYHCPISPAAEANCYARSTPQTPRY